MRIFTEQEEQEIIKHYSYFYILVYISHLSK